MVDLCARAGLLNEAWDLIKKMPGKRDEIVLGSLLDAVRGVEMQMLVKGSFNCFQRCNYLI